MSSLSSASPPTLSASAAMGYFQTQHAASASSHTERFDAMVRELISQGERTLAKQRECFLSAEEETKECEDFIKWADKHTTRSKSGKDVKNIRSVVTPLRVEALGVPSEVCVVRARARVCECVCVCACLCM